MHSENIPAMTNYTLMVVVRVRWPYILNFAAPAISLELLKLVTLNFLCCFIPRTNNTQMVDYFKWDVFGSCDVFKSWEISKLLSANDSLTNDSLPGSFQWMITGKACIVYQMDYAHASTHGQLRTSIYPPLGYTGINANPVKCKHSCLGHERVPHLPSTAV